MATEKEITAQKKAVDSLKIEFVEADKQFVTDKTAMNTANDVYKKTISDAYEKFKPFQEAQELSKNSYLAKKEEYNKALETLNTLKNGK